MASTDEFLEEERRRFGAEAVSRALTVENNTDALEAKVREVREEDRQAREDEYASWAMEIIVRARQRIGRTKWSSAEGQAKRRIVEALRCLAPDE